MAVLKSALGNGTDTASSTGSVHAKLTALSAAMGDSADVRSADSTLFGLLATTVKSVQRGTITMSGTSTDATITGVNMLKSIALHGGVTIGGSSDAVASAFMNRVVLTTSATVTAYRAVIGDVTNVSWQVIEFY